MLTEQQLKDFINEHNYDLRTSGNGRWIDQKCTPDVISFIADCILQYNDDENTVKPFTKNDIWHYQYAEEYVTAVFSKPSTNSDSLENEYDKFFAQPLKMFAYAGILVESKKGNSNVYTIKNIDVLNYISINERNAINFIYYYCSKVLDDSGLKHYFDDFFSTQNRDYFLNVKEAYIKFIQKNTEIKKDFEPKRIFTKVINPLAFKNKKLGTKRGNLSQQIITYAELMYNQENFRDLYANKPKGISRTEWEVNNPRDTNPNWFKYESARAKRAVREYNQAFNNGLSEMYLESDNAPATQIHHIFPEHAYHEIAMYHENLIALTPNQHMTKAHPKNDTRRIDASYQKQLLLSKINTIALYEKETPDGPFYSFDRLVEVLNIALGKDFPNENNTLESVTKIIEDNL